MLQGQPWGLSHHYDSISVNHRIEAMHLVFESSGEFHPYLRRRNEHISMNCLYVGDLSLTETI